jgi:hypothetical protein
VRTIRPVAAAVTTVLLGFFLVLFVYAWWVPAESGAPQLLDKVRAVAAGEAVARASVSDPESATFRLSAASARWGVPATCGEINYKNAAGGYIGFQRFVAAGPVAQLEEEMTAEQFRRLWSVMCE